MKGALKGSQEGSGWEERGKEPITRAAAQVLSLFCFPSILITVLKAASFGHLPAPLCLVCVPFSGAPSTTAPLLPLPTSQLELPLLLQ